MADFVAGLNLNRSQNDKSRPESDFCFLNQYPGWELNPHSRCGEQDFKSCVSTSSTTRVNRILNLHQIPDPGT